MQRITQKLYNTPWDARFVRITTRFGDNVICEYYRSEEDPTPLLASPHAKIMEASSYVKMTMPKAPKEPAASKGTKSPARKDQDPGNTDLVRGRELTKHEKQLVDDWEKAGKAKWLDDFPYLNAAETAPDVKVKKQAKIPVGQGPGKLKEAIVDSSADEDGLAAPEKLKGSDLVAALNKGTNLGMDSNIDDVKRLRQEITAKMTADPDVEFSEDELTSLAAEKGIAMDSGGAIAKAIDSIKQAKEIAKAPGSDAEDELSVLSNEPEGTSANDVAGMNFGDDNQGMGRPLDPNQEYQEPLDPNGGAMGSPGGAPPQDEQNPQQPPQKPRGRF